jgi:hypothetical protein
MSRGQRHAARLFEIGYCPGAGGGELGSLGVESGAAGGASGVAGCAAGAVFCDGGVAAGAIGDGASGCSTVTEVVSGPCRSKAPKAKRPTVPAAMAPTIKAMTTSPPLPLSPLGRSIMVVMDFPF